MLYYFLLTISKLDDFIFYGQIQYKYFLFYFTGLTVPVISTKVFFVKAAKIKRVADFLF